MLVCSGLNLMAWIAAETIVRVWQDDRMQSVMLELQATFKLLVSLLGVQADLLTPEHASGSLAY